MGPYVYVCQMYVQCWLRAQRIKDYTPFSSLLFAADLAIQVGAAWRRAHHDAPPPPPCEHAFTGGRNGARVASITTPHLHVARGGPARHARSALAHIEVDAVATNVVYEAPPPPAPLPPPSAPAAGQGGELSSRKHPSFPLPGFPPISWRLPQLPPRSPRGSQEDAATPSAAIPSAATPSAATPSAGPPAVTSADLLDAIRRVEESLVSRVQRLEEEIKAKRQ